MSPEYPVPGPDSDVVIGISSEPSVVKLRLTGVPNGADAVDRIFRELATAGIGPRSIARHGDAGLFSLELMVDASALPAFNALLPRLRASALIADVSIGAPSAPVSVIGSRLTARPSIAARMFRALSREGIDSECITTSTVGVRCLVTDEQRLRAIGALQAEFVEELTELQRGQDHVI